MRPQLCCINNYTFISSGHPANAAIQPHFLCKTKALNLNFVPGLIHVFGGNVTTEMKGQKVKL